MVAVYSFPFVFETNDHKVARNNIHLLLWFWERISQKQLSLKWVWAGLSLFKRPYRRTFSFFLPFPFTGGTSLIAQLVKNLPAMQETLIRPGSGRSAGEGIGHLLQYSWAPLVAQLIKNLPAVWETWVQSLGWEDPLKKGKAIHSSTLAWRIPWTVYSPWGHKESDTTERLSLSLSEVTCIPWHMAPSSIFKAGNCITLACLHQQISSPLLWLWLLLPPFYMCWVVQTC